MRTGDLASKAEVEARLAYLDGTPVGPSVRPNAARLLWRWAELDTQTDLGSLRTMWSRTKLGGQGKQTVGEVAQMVVGRAYPDAVLQTRILSFVEGIRSGTTDLIVTLVRELDGFLIADGNARCVALHILASEGTLPIELHSVRVLVGDPA